jgi:hypothetical protein
MLFQKSLDDVLTIFHDFRYVFFLGHDKIVFIKTFLSKIGTEFDALSPKILFCNKSTIKKSPHDRKCYFTKLQGIA